VTTPSVRRTGAVRSAAALLLILLGFVALPPSTAGAAASQGRSRIVFTGTKGLTSADAAGGDERVLITNRSQQFQDLPYNPVWSPDGSWIAFMRGFGIWVTRADGSETHQVAVFKANLPSWSADGRMIYYTAFYGPTTRIQAVNLDGTPGPEFSPTDGDETGAQWSPGGGRVAFASIADEGGHRVYVMNADGSGLQAITDGAASDFPQDWSPDGGRLLVTSNHDQLDVVVMDADGGRRHVVRPNAVPQAWSPDGRRILFYDVAGGPLRTMKADGTGVVTLEGMGGTGDWGPGTVDADTPAPPVDPTTPPTPTPPTPPPMPGPTRADSLAPTPGNVATAAGTDAMSTDGQASAATSTAAGPGGPPDSSATAATFEATAARLAAAQSLEAELLAARHRQAHPPRGTAIAASLVLLVGVGGLLARCRPRIARS